MASKSPLWEGVHHVALVTSDMDATMRFWHEVLGAEIVATTSTDVYRAYYFRVGETQTVAFMEYHGVDHERYAKPVGVAYPLASQFDHLSLNLGSEAAVLRAARAAHRVRLRGLRRRRPRHPPLDLLHRPDGHRARSVVVDDRPRRRQLRRRRPVPGSRSGSGARRVADDRRRSPRPRGRHSSTTSCASRARPDPDRRTSRTTATASGRRPLRSSALSIRLGRSSRDGERSEGVVMLGRSGRTRAFTLVIGLVSAATVTGVAGVASGTVAADGPNVGHAVDRHRR